jgi:hypothetical protein
MEFSLPALGRVAAAKLRLADASTSFSSGYLTAEFSISPGIPEARDGDFFKLG